MENKELNKTVKTLQEWPDFIIQEAEKVAESYSGAEKDGFFHGYLAHCAVAQSQTEAIAKHNADLLKTIERTENNLDVYKDFAIQYKKEVEKLKAENERVRELLKEVIDNVDFVSGDETIGKIFEYFKVGKVDQVESKETIGKIDYANRGIISKG